MMAGGGEVSGGVSMEVIKNHRKGWLQEQG